MIWAPPLRVVPLCAGGGARLQGDRQPLDSVWALPPVPWARDPTLGLAWDFADSLLPTDDSPDPTMLGPSVLEAGPQLAILAYRVEPTLARLLCGCAALAGVRVPGYIFHAFRDQEPRHLFCL